MMHEIRMDLEGKGQGQHDKLGVAFPGPRILPPSPHSILSSHLKLCLYSHLVSLVCVTIGL